MYGWQIAGKEEMKKEVSAWVRKRNKERRKLKWTFTKQQADVKLQKYYVA